MEQVLLLRVVLVELQQRQALAEDQLRFKAKTLNQVQTAMVVLYLSAVAQEMESESEET
jgi:hypothetical protein